MIDVTNERLLTFAQAANQFPGRPAIATLHRWRLHGVKGGVKLETSLVGGRRFTSLETLQRFAAALNGETVAAETRVTPQRRLREIEAAERELRDAGV